MPKEAPAKIDPTVAPDALAVASEGHTKAVIVVAGSEIPKGFSLSIVTEARKYTGGTEDKPLSVEVKKGHYPAGADVYIRTDPDVSFPSDAAEVLTLGDNLLQHNFWGFTRLAGHVNVGPAHPAYAAANLAYQRGATQITIIGLTEREQDQLRPAFDALATHAVEPAEVSVSFA